MEKNSVEEKKKTVLVVEDNELDRKVIDGVLKKRDFQVILLENGENCLDVIDEKKPDIILLDILMPGIPGNDLLQQIRKRYSEIELPVLMTTVKNTTSDIVESLALGANDYITKPIDFEVAYMRINTHLTIAEQSRELTKLRTLETVTALVATYNHEINNPLAIAISSLNGLSAMQEDNNYKRLEKALWRIAEMIKKVKNSVENSGIEFDNYGKSMKLIKLK